MPRPKKNPLPPHEWGDETPGERLAKIRKRRGYTQGELGNLLGITQSQVSDFEVGRTRLNDEMLVRFSEVLGVSTDNILGIKSKWKEELQLRYVKRILKAQTLNESDQKHILKTIDSLILSATTRMSS